MARHRIPALLALLLVATSCARREPPSLLLVTVDTLRADHVGMAGHVRPTSPNLDALAASGVRFSDSYSQAGWTLPSIASLLSGVHPSRHGATAKDRGLAPQLPTLATVLAEQGYQTRAYISHLFLRRRYGLARGFEIYDDSVLEVGHPHRVASGNALTERVLADLQTLEPPFFLWVHYFDPHFDYLSHPEWAAFGDGRLGRYDGEIAYTDRALGRLLQALEERGLLTDTVVVATADHGEEFGEHGGRFHRGVWEEILRVPLVVRAPGLSPAVREDRVQQIDLMPSALGLLGVTPPPGLPGRDLFAAPFAAPPIVVERRTPAPLIQEAVLSESWKLVRVRVDPRSKENLNSAMALANTAPGTYLFDLGEDPEERRDLFAERPDEARRLLALLRQHASARGKGTAVELDAETERKLRSLGYVQ